MMCSVTLCSATVWLLSAMLRYGLQVAAIVVVLMLASASADARTPMCVTPSTPTKHMCDNYGGNWGATALPPSWSVVVPRDEAVLIKLTDEKIRELLRKKKADFDFLRGVEVEAQLPAGTLRTKWLIESMAGELNIRNKSGFSGHFQCGDYECKRFKFGNPYKLREAAYGAVRLLRHYEQVGGIKITSPFIAYGYHQQGGNGLANIVTTGRGGKLRPDVKKNMLNNIPKGVKHEVFSVRGSLLLDDKQLALKFMQMWESEVNRINNIVLGS